MKFPRPVQAVVFDMDGLLFDTERVFRDALMGAGPGHGRAVDLPLFHSLVGVTRATADALLIAHFGDGIDVAAFRADVNGRMRAAMADSGVPLKTGAIELLAHLDLGPTPYALCTSSARDSALFNLGRHNLVERFAAIVAREDCANGKPHPEPYLKAAAALRIAPENCLALEDSHNGVRSAHAVGMMTVMAPDMLEATDEMRALTIAIAETLHDVRAALAKT